MTDTPVRSFSRNAETRQALVMAVGIYTFWGVIVGYFKLLSDVPVTEIIAHRAIWSFALVALILVFRRELSAIPAILADRGALLRLIASAALLYLNWGVFVYAVSAGRVLDSSFAYFINPILSVLLGLVLLGERMSRAAVGGRRPRSPSRFSRKACCSGAFPGFRSSWPRPSPPTASSRSRRRCPLVKAC